MKNQIVKYMVGIFMTLACTIPLLAGAGDPNDPDAGGDPGAPVDNWQLMLIMAGITIAMYFILHKDKKYISGNRPAS